MDGDLHPRPRVRLLVGVALIYRASLEIDTIPHAQLAMVDGARVLHVGIDITIKEWAR